MASRAAGGSGQRKTEVTSSWPLPKSGVRFLVPASLVARMRDNTLTREMYPVAAGYYPRAAGHHMRRRQHRNYLLMYCTEGRGEVTTAAGRFPVAAGDLIYLPAGVAHEYSSDKRDPWTLYWAHFDGIEGSTTLRQMPAWEAVTTIGLHPRIIADFERLFELRWSGDHLDAFIYGSYLLRQIVSYISLMARRHPPGRGMAIDLDLAVRFMQDHLHEHLTLEQLAAQTGLSKFHFSRKFTAATGQSPIQYFIHLKMQRGCQLLDASDRSIKQVAADLGYEDVYYFSRLFKKVMGLSPAQYRKNKHR
ncbi:AraC family transcriptional regulator [Microbulbifer marinus]|uniref:Transcriptional regulator, AraC family n=1 Tax=Microbulbifer marinus TaxID=658218 RepID=A0A1H3WXS7_9GAMM|nr:AraC family transcriptional regulator [Microbulbifer marinus]SDZ91142.1 transcriptional regulator, AraC family [Microbulbifer marinus]